MRCQFDRPWFESPLSDKATCTKQLTAGRATTRRRIKVFIPAQVWNPASSKLYKMILGDLMTGLTGFYIFMKVVAQYRHQRCCQRGRQCCHLNCWCCSHCLHCQHCRRRHDYQENDISGASYEKRQCFWAIIGDYDRKKSKIFGITQ